MDTFANKALNCLLEIIENPGMKKKYEEFHKLYLGKGFKHEAEAIEYLIEKKFINGKN
jgi:hypothetical protein